MPETWAGGACTARFGADRRESVRARALRLIIRGAAPNQLWVADITYIPTMAGFLSLAIVLEVFSRRIVRWRTRDTLHTRVVLGTLDIAGT